MSVNKETYLEYLQKANRTELLPTNRLAGLELKIVQELIRSDLLSDSEDRCGSTNETNKTFITPKGAVLLSDWERDLKQNSTWYKMGSALTRFAWVLVGVLSTLVAKVLVT